MKRILTILLAFVLLLSLASCGLFGKKPDQKDQTPTDAQTGQTDNKGDEPKNDDPTDVGAQEGSPEDKTLDGDKTEDNTEGNTGDGSGSQQSGGLQIGDSQGGDIGGSELEPDMKDDGGLEIGTDDPSEHPWGPIVPPAGN